jgi:hypothetical protein
MSAYDQHDWVCVAEVALELSAKACTDELVASTWIYRALDNHNPDDPAALASIGRVLLRLGGHTTDRRKREAIAGLVYCAVADAAHAAIERTLTRRNTADGTVARGFDFDTLVHSRHFKMLLETMHFVKVERDVARRNLEHALETEALTKSSPLMQIAKAFPERDLWQRVELSVRPVAAAFTRAAAAIAEGTLQIRQLVALKNCDDQEMFFAVLMEQGRDASVVKMLGRWFEADRRARLLLRQMLDSTVEVAPDAAELGLLRQIEHEWQTLPLVGIDVMLCGDGSHEPCCDVGSIDLPGVHDDSNQLEEARPALHAQLRGTALETLTTTFCGSRTIRMLSWLASVRGSPLFKEIRRNPRALSVITPPEHRGPTNDPGSVRRVATGGEPLKAAEIEVLGTVTIHKGSGPLGIGIAGPRDENDVRVGIFVADVTAGTPAAAHRAIVPGLRLMRVGGRDVTSVTQRECAALLDGVDTLDTIDIVFARHDAAADAFFGSSGNATPLEIQLTALFEAWRLLYSKMSTESITFQELTVFGPLLTTIELQCLAETASIGGSWRSWRRNNSTSSWAATRMVAVKQFMDLNQRRDALGTAIAVVNELGQYVASPIPCFLRPLLLHSSCCVLPVPSSNRCHRHATQIPRERRQHSRRPVCPTAESPVVMDRQFARCHERPFNPHGRSGRAAPRH